MESQSIERRVLVCFKKDLPAELLASYFDGVEELRKNFPDLEQFELHKFEPVRFETGLNSAVSDVIFPDVMTVWRFRDTESLEFFLASEKHMEIAKKKFRPAVESRIVFNSRPASYAGSACKLDR